MGSYYDGAKLLSLKDINGNVPEIYMCTSNRTAGKTTYFSRLLVNRFLKQSKKFMLLYRFNYELDDVADKFYKDIGTLFFPNTIMTSIPRSKGIYHDILINDKHCGYAVALNNADAIKKMSHLFSDTDSIYMDEFQSETNHYCPDEVTKFRSIHTSVARGQNKQVRYVPVYMCANPVTILNPYYVAMGITDRLDTKTKFLKGNGFVLEQGFNESAASAQMSSGFNSAFGNDNYNDYTAQGIYLNDNLSFIERPVGKSRYIATLRYNGNDYGLREFTDLGIMYCDNRPDITFNNRLSITTEDHKINYVMLRSNQLFISQLRYLFDKGCFRFRDLRSKEVILKALSY